MRRWFMLGLLALCLVGTVLLVTFLMGAQMRAQAQVPTGSIPTVTGSPVNAMITVIPNEQGYANLRSGPGTIGYDLVGVLPIGAQAPAIGRSIGGAWVQIAYPSVRGGVAWIYKDLVRLDGTPPIIEPPPTNTPQTTATIDATLAAQFLVEIPVTRLPTYTPPPTISIPTFVANTAGASPGRVPMGLIIILLAAMGIFGTIVSFLRGR